MTRPAPRARAADPAGVLVVRVNTRRRAQVLRALVAAGWSPARAAAVFRLPRRVVVRLLAAREGWLWGVAMAERIAAQDAGRAA